MVGGLDLFPPDPAIPMADYTASLTEVGIDFELLDVDAIGERWPQFALPAGTVGLYQDRGAIVPAGPGTAVMQDLARQHGAVLRDHAEVALGDGHLGRRWPTARRTPAVGVVLCADAWTDQLLAPLGVDLPLTVTLEQATYFGPERPGGLRAGPDAAVDLDGRAVVLRLPLLRRADREGGAGLRRPVGRSGRPRGATPTPGCSGCSPTTWRRMLPGSGGRCAHCAASTR